MTADFMYELDARRRNQFLPIDVELPGIVAVSGYLDAIDRPVEHESAETLGPFDDDDGGRILDYLIKTDRERGIVTRSRSPEIDVIHVESFGLVEIDEGKARTRDLIDIVPDGVQDPLRKKCLAGTESAGEEDHLAARELRTELLAE